MSIQCPYCEETNTKKNGKQNGKQRYLCKNCGRSFQNPYIIAKRTYSAERFFNTLYNLIESKETKISFDETSLDNINPYIKENNKKKIVIKSIPQRSIKNLVVHSYNLKIAIVFENDSEVQIYKYDRSTSKNETECYNIIIIDDEKEKS